MSTHPNTAILFSTVSLSLEDLTPTHDGTVSTCGSQTSSVKSVSISTKSPLASPSNFGKDRTSPYRLGGDDVLLSASERHVSVWWWTPLSEYYF